MCFYNPSICFKCTSISSFVDFHYFYIEYIEYKLQMQIPQKLDGHMIGKISNQIWNQHQRRREEGGSPISEEND